MFLPLVRFDQNTGQRLLPETCVPRPGSERELHGALHSPAAHPLQEREGLPDGAEWPRAPGASEEIHRLNSSQIT